MGAAERAAETFAHPAVPAGPDFEPFQFLERRQDGRAQRVGAGIGHRFHVLYDELPVDRQPYPHVVQRFARYDFAAKTVQERIGLHIGQVTFDIPQSVGAAKTAAFDGAGVNRVPVDGDFA